MLKFIVTALVLIFAGPAVAQVSTAGASYSDAQAISAVSPLIPAPSNVIPQSEAVGGAVGSVTSAFMRADAKLPRITRAGTATTDASGAWAITWAIALGATPAVLPIPVNAGTQPIACNVITATTTGATGKCWTGQTVTLNLSIITAGINLNPNATTAAGISVQVFAIPMTQ